MHERLGVHSVCFRGASLRELAEHWRALGVKRVSVHHALIEEEGVASMRDALSTSNVQLEAITYNFLPFGQQLDAADISWAGAQDQLRRVIADGEALGARSLQLFTGGHGALTWEDAAARFSAGIAPCVADAKAAALPIIVEEANPHYGHIHLAHSLRDAVTLAEMADIGVCLDVFSCWAEAGLQETIARAAARTALVQIGDYVFGDSVSPGRAVPGDGAISLQRILNWILRAGYDGAFEIEILGPRIDQEGHFHATRRALSHVEGILNALNA